VPAFTGALVKEGRDAARDLAERMAVLLGLWLWFGSVIGLLFMPQVIAVLAPGFAVDPGKFALPWTSRASPSATCR